MKRFIVLLLIFVICFTMCSCGEENVPKGSYSAYLAGEKFMTITFKGDKVLSEQAFDDGASEGTFEMEENVVKVTYENGNYDEFTYDSESDSLDYMGLLTFAKD